MPIKYKLDKYLKVGTVYQTPPDMGYLITEIGTSAGSDVKLVVDGRPTGAIKWDFAPPRKYSSNTLGLLKLGDYYYVIPPDRKFWIEGPTGASMRVRGYIIKLLPGEAFPSDLLARYEKQHKEYITYIAGSYSIGADVAWAPDVEYDVLEYTPKTIEEVVLDSVVMAKVENSATTIDVHMVGVRFYLDGTPLDILTSEPGPKGVDIKAMPYPPSDADNKEPFTLADTPIVVPGDHTLKISMVNISGSNITPTSGNSLVLKVLAVIKYRQKG